VSRFIKLKVPSIMRSFNNRRSGQLLSLAVVGKERSCPIYFPRNLAKSVTVE
jgi:glucosamine 6-phosphate synthetase-like amidotransferase/phosphosugar isomerase protein